MDSLDRLISKKYNLRGYAVNSRNAADEIISVKMTSPLSSYILGQSINAALLVSASLKPETDQNLTFKIEGSGKLKSVIVQADARGNIRASIANSNLDSSMKIGEAIGAGVINVSKDIGFDNPYNGVSPILGGDIAYDTAYYLTQSEQIPSALLIGFSLNDNLSVKSSGGILIQTFPDTPISSIEYAEKMISDIKSGFSERISSSETPLSILYDIFGKNETELLSSIPVRFKCRCSKEIVLSTLKLIERSEIEDILKKDKSCEISCAFCEKKYHFDESELTSLLS